MAHPMMAKCKDMGFGRTALDAALDPVAVGCNVSSVTLTGRNIWDLVLSVQNITPRGIFML